MIRTTIRTALLSVALFFLSLSTYADNKLKVKGIYITQYTITNTAYMQHLIKQAKETGIDTFVIDVEFPNSRARQNIAMVKDNGISFVARIVMFHGGGTAAQIKNPDVWQKKYGLVKLALDMGADAIQLDYIRYNTRQRKSPENAKDIMKIISWYKDKLASQKIPLQIDVFGETSFGESPYIGQNAQLFADTVDVLCPMVYPSHYYPPAQHYKTPYETVLNSLERIQKQFPEQSPVEVIAYIELSNYHFPMSGQKRMDYIRAQLKAVHDSGVEGWYAWSPHNKYEYLFKVLKEQQETASKVTAEK